MESYCFCGTQAIKINATITYATKISATIYALLACYDKDHLLVTKKRNETLEKFLPNSVLLIDKVINTTGFKKLLANHRQFAKFSIDLNKELNLILN